jgi:hypothetical protein
MTFIIGEIVELKEDTKRFPLQSTEIISPTCENYIIKRPCVILMLKIFHNMSAYVLVNGQVGWIPISVLQKIT